MLPAMTKPKKIDLPNSKATQSVDVNLTDRTILVGQAGDKKGSPNLFLLEPETHKIKTEIEKEPYEIILRARFFNNFKNIVYLDTKSNSLHSYDLAKNEKNDIKTPENPLLWLNCQAQSEKFLVSSKGIYIHESDKENPTFTLSDDSRSDAVKNFDEKVRGALNPSGEKVAISGLEDREIQIYNIASDKVEISINNLPDACLIWLDYSPDEKYLAGISLMNRVPLIWRMDDLSLIGDTDFYEEFNCLRFSPDGEFLAFGTLAGYCEIFELKSQKFVNSINSPSGKIMDLAFSQDSSQIYMAGLKGLFACEL
jgi:WD40 repeat protein